MKRKQNNNFSLPTSYPIHYQKLRRMHSRPLFVRVNACVRESGERERERGRENRERYCFIALDNANIDKQRHEAVK